LYQEEDKSAPSFFSVGGGILGGYFKPNFSGFNSSIAVPFSRQAVAERVWMVGGEGFITLPWIKNLRVGGMAYSGVSDCGCGDTIPDGLHHVGRLVDYEIGYGALTIDYVLPIKTGRFHIVPGIALGLGSVNIFTRQAATPEDVNFSNYTAGYPNTTHTYTSHFFVYMPQVQFEYAPLGYLMLRLSAGYQGTSMGTWTVDRNVTLASTDAFTNINGSGLIASLGLFLGLFQ
jgi:hypothetical protein